MKLTKSMAVAGLVLVAGSSWGYGSKGGGGPACDRPRFTEFTPPEKAEVAPGSGFSFVASSAYPDSIEVVVRGQPVAVKVRQSDGKYLVSGTLPGNLKGTYARISVSAYGPNRCRGTDGWLVKITE